MGDAVIVLTADQLRTIVREEVTSAMRACQPQAAEYLDLAGVADLLDVTTTTIRTYIRRDGFPVHRLGTKTLRFARADVDRWLVERAARRGGRAGATRGTLVRLHGLETQGR